MNIIWIIVGFIGGVIISKNSADMNTPSTAAAIVAMIAGCAVAWTAAYHGKRQAVHSAVATAVATATAQARSEAAAAAQSIVNLYGLPHELALDIGPQRSIMSEDRQALTQGETSGQDHAQSRGVEHRRGLPRRPLRRDEDPRLVMLHERRRNSADGRGDGASGARDRLAD